MQRSPITRNWKYPLLVAALGAVAGALLALALGSATLWVIGAMVLLGVAVLSLQARGIGTSEEWASKPQESNSLPALVREVIVSAPDPMMLLDISGRAIIANKALNAIAGTDAESKPVSAVIRNPAVLRAIQDTSETGEPSSVEFSERVPVERHYQAMVTRTEHSPYFLLLLLHDLTALRKAEQARADFIANASHELRTPLAALTGFIDTLRGHARDDEPARERFLGIMQIEAQRMRRLIEDLLSLTRIELNEHVPPSDDIDLATVVRDATATLAPLAEVENVALSVEAAPDLPLVRGERDELIQVFQNLIHNGIKYGRPGGHVRVTLSTAPGELLYARGNKMMVCTAVRDDGEGIPREAVPRLTERFYRVDVKRSRERGGTGLGLAIVKHIVNRHQGRIAIDSRPGEGSTFTIFLPAAEHAHETTPAAVTELL